MWDRLRLDKRVLAFAIPVVAGAIAALVLASTDLVVYMEGSLSSVVLVGSVMLGIVAAAIVAVFSRRAAATEREPEFTAEPGARSATEERLAMLSNLYDAVTARLVAIDARLSEAVPDPDAAADVRKEIARLEQFLFDVHGVASLHDVEPARQEIDAGELVDSVIGQTERAAGDRTLKADVPARPTLLTGDRRLLSLALINLIINAVKFSTPEAPIIVRAIDRGDRIAFQVEDMGPGVPDGEDVWGELARGSNADGVPGSGLGLALVRVVAQAHGGTADLESGRPGTVATLEIPRR